jgi:cytochrome c
LVLVLRVHAQGAADDPATAGKRVFRACQACHALDALGSTDAGPTLYGLFGRQAGSANHFMYSNAMKNSGIVWSEATLDAFLKNPQSYIPANAMPFGGVSNAEDRARLLAYLKIATAPER